MTRYAQVNVVVKYQTNVEIPDGMTTEEYVHERWKDYDDELIPENTERSILETWDDEEEEAGDTEAGVVECDQSRGGTSAMYDLYTPEAAEEMVQQMRERQRYTVSHCIG